jgi:dihydrofolate synthase / folylpolyglutamate synthase
MDPFEYFLSLERFGIKLGLENIRTLCEALGQPHARFPSILVGGTNGKGSVTAMVDRALRAAGLRVGRYTSPHLVRVEERFVVDGRPVDAKTLARVTERVRAAVDELTGSGRLHAQPTFFEVTTAVALELFRLAPVDLAVLEVGLGGRFDATNVVDPIAAAIVSIDFDHEQHLGETLEAIAFEKAGIVRPGIPVVVGEVKPGALAVIGRACRERGARMVEAPAGARATARLAAGRTQLDLSTPLRDYGTIELSLRGLHQAANAIVAVRLLEELGPAFPVPADAVLAGLQDARWPGRLDLVTAASGRQVLLDGAHNPAGAAALAAYLREVHPGGLPMVVAAMRDKNAARMLDALLPSATRLVFTEPPVERARPAAELAELARARGFPADRIGVDPSPAGALERAWSAAPLVCATGSLFLVGALLEAIDPRGSAGRF